MIVHIPVYSPTPDDSSMNNRYLVLLLVCLDSYYVHQNCYPLMVSTNNKLLYESIHAFQQKTNYPFQIEYFSEEELQELFQLREGIYNHPFIHQLFYSKFTPMLKVYDDQIVHVDYDTLFLRKINLEHLMRFSLNLVRHSNLGYYSVNTGVFGVQKEGFELCKKKIAGILNDFDFEKGIYKNDEELVEAFLLAYHDLIFVTETPWLNCLAYDLINYPSWKEKVEIIHFHWFKPYNFILTSSGQLLEQLKTEPVELYKYKHRLNSDFYEAIKLWHHQLHHAFHISQEPALRNFIIHPALS